jgi:hypothetical protein
MPLSTALMELDMVSRLATLPLPHSHTHTQTYCNVLSASDAWNLRECQRTWPHCLLIAVGTQTWALSRSHFYRHIYTCKSALRGLKFPRFCIKSNWTEDEHNFAHYESDSRALVCTEKAKQRYLCSRPRRSICVRRRGSHRWQRGCQPNAPADHPLPAEWFLILISCVNGCIDLKTTQARSIR